MGDEQRNQWHLDKRLSASHIMTSMVLIGALLGVYMDNQSQHQLADKRITVIETQIESDHERDNALRARMDGKLGSIENKIDKLIERELNRNGH